MHTVALPDGRQVKLGCVLPKSRPTALRFSVYFDKDAIITPPPDTVDYATNAMASIVEMYGNDQQGDCVLASAMHQVGVWTGNATGTPAVGTTREALAQYHAIAGPGDNGMVVTDVLDYRQTHGIVVGGVVHKIEGYVAADWTDKLQVQVAIDLFGVCDLAVNLPGGWESSDVWDMTNSGFVGGHCIPAIGYNADGVTISTWGGTRLITWEAFTSRRYLVECYPVLSPDWTSNSNMTRLGVDDATLQADLEKIKGGSIPPIPPAISPNGPFF